MATLYVTEFADPRILLGVAGVVAMPPAVEQAVAIAGSSGQSSAFGATTRIIRVHTDAICSIALGSNPTATTAKMRLAANQTEYFGCNPGDKIAVISNS